MPGMHKKILVVDDHPIFRTGLCAALADTGRWDPIGQAACVAEAIETLETEAWPVLLLDLNLPDGDGFAVLEACDSLSRKPATLVLSMHMERDFIQKAFRLGALGYASKNLAFAALEQGLQTVAQGQVFMEHDVLKALDLFEQRQEDDPACVALLETLAPREKELLAWLLSGYTVKEAALHLKVSARTAENYQSSIYSKLGAASPVHLVTIALKAGCPGITQSFNA